MSLTILIESDAAGVAPARLTLDAARVVLGRSASSDVRLPDPSVSQRHAIIQASAGQYSVLDEGSLNGTWVGGVRLALRAPRVLRSGDRMRLGRVWLEVKLDQSPATADLPGTTRELALAFVARAMRDQGHDAHPTVHIVEGPHRGATLALDEEGRVYRLGRGESCDLALDDPDASREHVQIVRRGGVVLVRDLASKNGVKLGDADLPPGRDVPWRAPVTLRVGAHLMKLEEPVAAALGDLEACPDEPMSEEALDARESVAPSPELTADRAPPYEAAPRSSPGAKSTAESQKSGVSSLDIWVIGVALAILGLSLAGLYWLLRS